MPRRGGGPEVAATFDTGGLPELAELHEGLGIEDGGESILRRRISPDGRSRAWINDSSVSDPDPARDRIPGWWTFRASTLTTPCSAPAHQLRVLDAAAGHAELVTRTGELHRQRASVESDLHAARAVDGTERERRIDYLSFQCDELDGLGANPREAADLTAELQRLAHAVEIRSAADEIENALASGEHAAGSAVHRALARLADIERRVPGSTDSAPRAPRDGARSRHRGKCGGPRPRAGHRTPTRRGSPRSSAGLAALHDAGRKHRVSPDALPDHLATLRAELEGLESGEARIHEIEEACSIARAAYLEAAKTSQREPGGHHRAPGGRGDAAHP